MSAVLAPLLALSSKVAWGVVLLGAIALLAGRLRSDKRRYLATLDHLESAATQAEAITGFPGGLAQDLDRCRSFETYRRKAGELLFEAHRQRQWDRYRARLREIDRAWADLEDAVTAVPVQAQHVRRHRENVVALIQSLKRRLREDSRHRLSLIVFGGLPPADM